MKRNIFTILAMVAICFSMTATFDIIQKFSVPTIKVGTSTKSTNGDLMVQAPQVTQPLREEADGDVLSFPYINAIYDNRSQGDLTTAPHLGGGTPWTYVARGFVMRITPVVNQGSNWLMTPQLAFEDDVEYTLRVWGTNTCIASGQYLDAPMELRLGAGDDPDSYTQVVSDSFTIKNSNVVYRDTAELKFHSDVTGAQRLAFRMYPFNVAVSGNAGIYYISITSGGSAAAPDSVKALEVTPAELGELKATVSVTTPDKTVGGDDLTELSMLKVLRDGTEIFSQENPEPGATYTFEDNEPVNGFNTYSAYCVGDGNDGPAREVTKYIGLDAPAAVKHLKLIDLGNGTLRLTWDLPEGQHGGYVDPESVTYGIFDINRYGQGTKIADVVADYSFERDTTYTGAEPGDQVAVNMGVRGSNEYGTGSNVSTWCVLGMAYPLPYKESFVDQQMQTNLWTVTVEKGTYSSFSTSEINSQDNDHGVVYLDWTNTGEVVRLESPKIDISQANHPVLSFYYRGARGQQVVTEVLVYKNGNEEETVATLDYDNIEDLSWNLMTVDLSDYINTSYIRFALRSTIINVEGVYVNYDNFVLRDVEDNDLAVKLSGPSIAEPGEEFTINATVTNVGDNDVTDDDVYTLNVYADDELIGTEEETDLAVNEEQDFVFTYSVPEGGNKHAALRAEVVWNKDTKTDNNLAELTVGINQTALDTIHDLTGSTADAVALEWGNPDDMSARITDSFEDYPDFACDTIGDYTCYNSVNYGPGFMRYVFTSYYPHSADFKAFYLFNAHAEGYDQFAEDQRVQANTGNKLLYTSSIANEGYEMQDAWIISPELPGNEQVFTFYGKTYAPNYGLERVQVYYSTSNERPDAFHLAQMAKVPATSEFNMALDVEIPGSWTQFGAYLPEGTKYLAVRYCSFDKYVLFMDDFTYNIGEMPIDHYNVYRNGELIGSTTDKTFTDEEGQQGDEYTVTVVYDNGMETGPSNVYVADTVTALREIKANDNCADNNVYSIDGRMLRKGTVSVEGLPAGIYIAGGKKVIVR